MSKCNLGGGPLGRRPLGVCMFVIVSLPKVSNIIVQFTATPTHIHLPHKESVEHSSKD